ncbi:hypothetical protein [Thioalkalivibrio sp. AKL10]|uniref:hypothetical protein n=1 Tax=Thioalkalivibrio sp. AKL10 TaxID=1158158 RepID=UPI000378D52C|nr:hypothetical protein [Thioalkalivibrio sp. AKL10]
MLRLPAVPFAHQSWCCRLHIGTLVGLVLLVGSPLLAHADGAEDWLAAIAESPLGEPIAVTSTVQGGVVEGAVHARLPYSFALVASELEALSAWCEITVLHINIKSCVYREGADALLHLYVGRARYEQAEYAERVELVRRSAQMGEDWLLIELEGDRGPYGTRDYSIVVHVVPHDTGTLVNLEYSLRFGVIARLAALVYLATGGRERVGFTVVGYENGEPQYIGGLEGMIERTVMRFYLALQAWLDVRDRPAQELLLARLERWFDLTDEYPRQLRELDRETYLEQKQREYANQQRLQDAPPPRRRILPLD